MREILKQILSAHPAGSSANVYEVRCHDCDVSFPVGTKRCIHCGGRTGSRPIFEEQIAADPQVVFAPNFAPTTDSNQFAEMSSDAVESIDPFADTLDEEKQPRGSIVRALGNLSWFLVIAALYLYRSCAG